MFEATDVPSRVRAWADVVLSALSEGLDTHRLPARRRLLAWTLEHIDDDWEDDEEVTRLVHSSAVKRALSAHDEWSFKERFGLRLTDQMLDWQIDCFIRETIERALEVDDVVLKCLQLHVPANGARVVRLAVVRFGGWEYQREDQLLGPFARPDDLATRLRRGRWLHLGFLDRVTRARFRRFVKRSLRTQCEELYVPPECYDPIDWRTGSEFPDWPYDELLETEEIDVVE